MPKPTYTPDDIIDMACETLKVYHEDEEADKARKLCQTLGKLLTYLHTYYGLVRAECSTDNVQLLVKDYVREIIEQYNTYVLGEG